MLPDSLSDFELFSFELADYATAARDLLKVFKQNVRVFGIEGNKTVTAVFFEISLAVKNEYSKLTVLDTVRFLAKQNVAVAVLGLHTVALDAKSKIRRRGLLIVGNIYS